MTTMRSTRPARLHLARALRLSAAIVGVGLMLGANVAFAQSSIDDDDDTFEEKIIKNIMTGLGGTTMENTGIEYRERSPLVVPPKIELRAPDDGASANVANWPKDPDVRRRKQAKAANSKPKQTPEEASRPLTPNEMNAVRSGPESRTVDSSVPGNSITNPIMSPSQLGFNGSLMGMLGGGNKSETAPFKGEPTRDSLTMPPSGYQTPSSNFAYGTGPRESLNKEYNPALGKY